MSDVDVNLCEYLLNRPGIDATLVDDYGNSALHYACQSTSEVPFVVLEKLIEKCGADAINARNKNGQTPLHILIQCTSRCDVSADIYECLLSKPGIDAILVDDYGNTALHYACQHASKVPLVVFKKLIEEYGADVNILSRGKQTPIHVLFDYAEITHVDVDVLRYLLSQTGIAFKLTGDGDTVLHLACRRFSKVPLDVFKLLIEDCGADINACNDYRQTPLHYFLRCPEISNVSTDVHEYLLSRPDIDPALAEKYGGTILHVACRRFSNVPVKVVEHLIGEYIHLCFQEE